MPAKSKKQQMAAGAALAAKRGKRSKSSLKGASRGMYKSMSKAELRKMAKTKRKGKPTKTKRREKSAEAFKTTTTLNPLALCPSRLPVVARLPSLSLYTGHPRHRATTQS